MIRNLKNIRYTRPSMNVHLQREEKNGLMGHLSKELSVARQGTSLRTSCFLVSLQSLSRARFQSNFWPLESLSSLKRLESQKGACRECCCRWNLKDGQGFQEALPSVENLEWVQISLFAKASSAVLSGSLVESRPNELATKDFPFPF